MKKLIAIFFFLIYLLSTTEAHQLLKLPVVFQHFAEHKRENNDITFLKFLSIHYMHGSPRDADYDRDMQLPFKTFGDCITAITVAFVPLTMQYALSVPVVLVQKKRQIPFDQLLVSSYLSKIWQPPKFS